MWRKLQENLSELGFWWGLLAIVIGMGLVFGLMCANAAMLMVFWNATAAAIIGVCTPISFWQAFLVPWLIWTLRWGVLSAGSKIINGGD